MRVPLALSAIVVAVPLACPAQGTLSFNSGASLVRYEDGVGATVGEVQFAWAPVGTAFTPWTPALTASAWMAANPGWTVVGSPVRVGIPLAGRFIGGTLTINVMPPGAVVQRRVISA